jgi:hypothetical protein
MIARLQLFPVYRLVRGLLPLLLGVWLLALAVPAGRSREIALALGMLLLGVAKILRPTPQRIGERGSATDTPEARQRAHEAAAIGTAPVVSAIETLGFILVVIAGLLALSDPA